MTDMDRRAANIAACRTLDELEGYIMGIDIANRGVSDAEVALLERRVGALTATGSASRGREVSARLRAVVARQRGAVGAGEAST